MHHEKYMQRCLELARGGEGFVAPNPLVGAVLVHGEEIISEGYHHKFGGAHAEVEALKNIHDTKALGKATLYVNLEPCSHHGKTPPCVDLILEKGITKVVIANSDPNPLVSGNGIKKLKKAGVEVQTGVLEKEGQELNRRFFTFHKQKRPYIILKWAQTSNGYIAPSSNPGQITWISNKSSQLLVHKWRTEEQAVLVGRNTVESDNPQLTARHFNKKNPMRLVIDPSLKLNGDFNIFNQSAPTLIFNTLKSGNKDNIRIIKLKKGPSFLSDILKSLYIENIQSVIVEGGTTTLKNFIDSGFWDEARIFTGPVSFTDGIKAPPFEFNPVQLLNIDGDQLAIYRNNQAKSL